MADEAYQTTTGFRRNNPGNLREREPPFPYIGKSTKQDGAGTFTRFIHLKWGTRALFRDLRRKCESAPGVLRSTTTYAITSIYAPLKDGNDPWAYAVNLGRLTNLDPQKSFLLNSDELHITFVKGIILQEIGGTLPTFTDDFLVSCLSLEKAPDTACMAQLCIDAQVNELLNLARSIKLGGGLRLKML
jgi:hypothetical protein